MEPGKGRFKCSPAAAMTALAGDRLFREEGTRVLVRRAANVQRPTGVAQDALLTYRPGKIRIGDPFETGSQIVFSAIGVVADWRLEEMIPDLD